MVVLNLLISTLANPMPIYAKLYFYRFPNLYVWETDIIGNLYNIFVQEFYLRII